MKTGKNNQTLSKTEKHSSDIPWFTQMEQDHAKAAGLLKNILTSNGYLSFENALSDIERSYDIFKTFLENQSVELSMDIKTDFDFLKSALISAFKNIEMRFKLT